MRRSGGAFFGCEGGAVITSFEWPIGSFPDGETSEFSVEWSLEGLGLSSFDGGGLRFFGPMLGSVRAFRDGEEAHARIRGSAEAEQMCVRCLEPAPFRFSVDFEMFYRPRRFQPNYWEDEEEVGLGYYENGSIDLSGDVRRHAQLEIALFPLCREECLGLCSGCGANLNADSCGCGSEPRRGRSAIGRQLDQLFNLRS